MHQGMGPIGLAILMVGNNWRAINEKSGIDELFAAVAATREMAAISLRLY
jgi:hypothetical protein